MGREHFHVLLTNFLRKYNSMYMKMIFDVAEMQHLRGQCACADIVAWTGVVPSGQRESHGKNEVWDDGRARPPAAQSMLICHALLVDAVSVGCVRFFRHKKRTVAMTMTTVLHHSRDKGTRVDQKALLDAATQTLGFFDCRP